MTTSEFITILRSSYSGYTREPGQLNAIENYIKKATDSQRAELILAIQNEWKQEKGRAVKPPWVANVRDIAKKHNIYIDQPTETHLLWKCGQCAKVYEYEIDRCTNIDCGKRTVDLPVMCSCGTFFHDHFVCCQTSGKKSIITDIRNDERMQEVYCEICGKKWTSFPRCNGYIFTGMCKNCGKPRTSGTIIKR